MCGVGMTFHSAATACVANSATEAALWYVREHVNVHKIVLAGFT